MKATMSRGARRFWLGLHLAAMISLWVSFYVPPSVSEYVALISVAVGVLSGYLAFSRSGAYRFCRRKTGQLDERELQIVHMYYRRAYRVIVEITWIAVIISCLFLERGPFGEHIGVLAGILLTIQWVTHHLPSALAAWTEKEIYRD